MTVCNGDGSCLIQADNLNTYVKSEKIQCSHNCQPVECPNFQVCSVKAPQWYFKCHKGTCLGCKLEHGHLDFIDNSECPICFENKISVKTNKCKHAICIDCFKRLYYPVYWNVEWPKFPYDSDVEDEYEANPEDDRWQVDELIKKYEETCERLEDERMSRYKSEENLRRCPLCRK